MKTLSKLVLLVLLSVSFIACEKGSNGGAVDNTLHLPQPMRHSIFHFPGIALQW